MQKRSIAHFQVNPIGLGCMNLSHAYGVPPAPEQAKALLLGALDAGYDFFDTATLYGFGANETLIGEVLSPHRQQLTLASKCGMGGEMVDGKMTRVIDGSPAKIRAQCEASLKRLKTDVIDLYYLHRWDKKVPIEESVGALADLQRAGKIQSIGLSEVGEATLRKAWLALAWLLHKNPALVAIPGTTQLPHLKDNFAASLIQLDAQAIKAVEALLDKALIVGNRYNEQARREVDTEEDAGFAIP
ncbi:MAG: aldo/keto reductase [Cytophagales bacterium]|nr:aldo/keto reductase [Cytophagales bacterium]